MLLCRIIIRTLTRLSFGQRIRVEIVKLELVRTISTLMKRVKYSLIRKEMFDMFKQLLINILIEITTNFVVSIVQNLISLHNFRTFLPVIFITGVLLCRIIIRTLTRLSFGQRIRVEIVKLELVRTISTLMKRVKYSLIRKEMFDMFKQLLINILIEITTNLKIGNLF